MPRIAPLLVLAVCLVTTGAGAETLALPNSLVDLRSHQGEDFLFEAQAREAYFPISAAFETQKTQAYCGVASLVMTLNAIGVPAPSTPEYEPYRIFTQDNVLNEGTDKILPRDTLARRGMTLDQLGHLLERPTLAIAVHHADAGGLDEFRRAASAYLAARGHVVLVNYLRRSLGQERGGHISPLAAYDGKSDRFLILDVARYKYPPVWATAADLFGAMNTIDLGNEGRTRGYVLIAEIATAVPRANAQPISAQPTSAQPTAVQPTGAPVVEHKTGGLQ